MLLWVVAPVVFDIHLPMPFALICITAVHVFHSARRSKSARILQWTVISTGMISQGGKLKPKIGSHACRSSQKKNWHAKKRTGATCMAANFWLHSIMGLVNGVIVPDFITVHWNSPTRAGSNCQRLSYVKLIPVSEMQSARFFFCEPLKHWACCSGT